MFHDVSFYFNKGRYERNWSDSCHITVFSGNIHWLYPRSQKILRNDSSCGWRNSSNQHCESRNTLKSFSLFQIVETLLKLNKKRNTKNAPRIKGTFEPNVLLTKRRFVSGDFLVMLVVWFSLTLHYPKGGWCGACNGEGGRVGELIQSLI